MIYISCQFRNHLGAPLDHAQVLVGDLPCAPLHCQFDECFLGIEHVTQAGGFKLEKPAQGIALQLQRAIGEDLRHSYVTPFQCAAHQQRSVTIKWFFFCAHQRNPMFASPLLHPLDAEPEQGRGGQLQATQFHRFVTSFFDPRYHALLVRIAHLSTRMTSRTPFTQVQSSLQK